MKKRHFLFIVVISVLFCAMLLTSCNLLGGGKSSYTITLVSNGGTSLSPIRIGEGNNDVSLPEPIRTGYVFAGWFTSNAFTESWSQFLENNNYVIKSDITLYAKWYPISGDVILNVNGGNAIDNTLFSYAAGLEMNLPIPTRTGNIFDGWFDKARLPNATRVTDSTGVFMPDENAEGDITLYAHWLVKVSVLPREQAGQVTTGRGYYYIDSENAYWINFSATPAPHYTFKHWIFGDEIHSDAEYSHTFTEDVEISAVFEGEESTLTADPNCEGKAPIDYLVYYGETFTIPVPTNPGNVFEGWFSLREGGVKLSDRRGLFSDYKKYANLTVYAHWQEGTFSTDYTYEAQGSPVSSYKITGYTGDEDVLYIPYEFAGTPVVEIGPSFSAIGRSKVVIPSSITTISPSAFEGYSGNIYFDQGFSNLILINSQNFKTTHNIYVHGTYVLSAQITTSTHQNTVSSGDLALIDDVYYDFFGNISHSNIDTFKELQAFLNYHIVFSVGNPIAFSLSYTEAASEEVNKAFSAGMKYYKHNTYLPIGKEGHRTLEYTHQGNSIELPELSEKTENRLASQSTNPPDVIVIPPFTYSYEIDSFPDVREFAIDSRNPYVVYNSEQLVYAVENGFKPIFFEENISEKVIYEEAKSILLEIIPPDINDDIQKITIIHDWILDNVVYDHNLLDLSTQGVLSNESIIAYDGFYLEGVFSKGKAVCDGLSKAFMLMCRIEGIEAIRVSGETVQSDLNVGHAWNKVKILDKWYSIDLTGNDASIRRNNIDGQYYEIRTHKYFLIPDSIMDYKNLEIRETDNPFYVYYESKGNYNHFKNTLIENADDTALYIENTTQLGKIATAFKNFVNLQEETGRYALELMFDGTPEESKIIKAFGSLNHSMPYKVGETNDYFVIIMIDKS